MGVNGVETVVERGVVPLLLVLGVLAAGVSAGQVRPRARSAAYGGVWSGLLAVVGVVLALDEVQVPVLPRPSFLLIVGEIAAGVVTGVGLAAGYLRTRTDVWVAIPLGAQMLGALGGLYLFFLAGSWTPHLAWTSLAIASSSSIAYALLRDRWPRPRVYVRPPLPDERGGAT